MPGAGTRDLGKFREGLALDENNCFSGTVPWDDIAIASGDRPDPKLALIKIDAREPGLLALPGDVLFDFNKSILRTQATDLLNQLKGILIKKNITKATIEGHTDSSGPQDYNLRLPKARADAVRSWLMLNGVPGAALWPTVGKGETFPIASNSTNAGRQQNRRVVVRFV